ncbi:hypothetical protein B0H13DRAFT_1850781 [Mycena leptocephala]|nr:hypothetical protein B0H13DRAFT_1850781 [Mycena leptocephala]
MGAAGGVESRWSKRQARWEHRRRTREGGGVATGRAGLRSGLCTMRRVTTSFLPLLAAGFAHGVPETQSGFEVNWLAGGFWEDRVGRERSWDGGGMGKGVWEGTGTGIVNIGSSHSSAGVGGERAHGSWGSSGGRKGGAPLAGAPASRRRALSSNGITEYQHARLDSPGPYARGAVDEERHGGKWLESGRARFKDSVRRKGANRGMVAIVEVGKGLLVCEQNEVVWARVVLFLAAPAGGIVSASLTTPPATAQARRPRLIGGCWEHRPERAGSASECATAPPAAGCRCLFAIERSPRLVTVPASPQGSRSAEVCGVSRHRRGRRHIWRQVDTAVEGEVAEFFESRRGGGSIRGDSPYGDKSQGVWVLLTGPKVEPEATLMQSLR